MMSRHSSGGSGGNGGNKRKREDSPGRRPPSPNGKIKPTPKRTGELIEHAFGIDIRDCKGRLERRAIDRRSGMATKEASLAALHMEMGGSQHWMCADDTLAYIFRHTGSVAGTDDHVVTFYVPGLAETIAEHAPNWRQKRVDDGEIEFVSVPIPQDQVQLGEYALNGTLERDNLAHFNAVYARDALLHSGQLVAYFPLDDGPAPRFLQLVIHVPHDFGFIRKKMGNDVIAKEGVWRKMGERYAETRKREDLPDDASRDWWREHLKTRAEKGDKLAVSIREALENKPGGEQNAILDRLWLQDDKIRGFLHGG
jgi:hypothetical protein